jgi:methionine aminotransferase
MTTSVPVTSKLPDIGVSIFAIQSRLANEHNAINLSQGFPDFDCDPALVDAVTRAMQDGHNQYAPMPRRSRSCTGRRLIR